MEETIGSEIVSGKDENYFPLYINSDKFKKLLVVQTTKEGGKFWFKDKEISMEKLVEILEKIDY